MVQYHHPFELETAASMKILSGKTQRHPLNRRELGPLTKLNAPEKVIITKEVLRLWRIVYHTISTLWTATHLYVQHEIWRRLSKPAVVMPVQYTLDARQVIAQEL